ncbi:MAG: hypothetical protein AAFX93_09405 [Verrucomicrobiota bacterium]
MPLLKTQRGLDVTAESEEAVAAIEAFEDNLLGILPGAEDILKQADTYPATPLIQAYAAMLMIYSQAAGPMAEAAKPLERARALLADATPREIQFVTAIDYFQQREFDKALDQLEQLTTEYPLDLVAAKISEFLYYCHGQHYNAERFLWHMMRLREANGNHPGFLSMLSFAFELCGRYGEARAAAEVSLEQTPGQAWSHHTLAHLLIRTGKLDEGVREMERFSAFWPECARGIHAHNAWHRALFYVEQTDWARSDELLRSDIWGIMPEYVGEQVDAIALMWRMDLAGAPASDELWQEVAAYVAPHAGECIIPFLEGHFLYALGRAGQVEAAEAAVAKARERAMGSDTEAQNTWNTIGADFSAACAAWGQGDHSRALQAIEPKVDLLPRVGGSDAQDDLFRLAYFSSLVGVGRKSEAINYFPTIAPAKAPTPLDELLMSN